MKAEELHQASKNQLLREIDRLHSLLWHAGVCSQCGEEIQHDIDEPFYSCKCGHGEATTIPTIAQLRHEIALLKRPWWRRVFKA